MRKSIRRGLFVTATAGFVLLGFGLAQASAAVPALPSVPSVPSLPTVPGMNGIGGLDGLGGFGDLATMRELPANTNGLPAVGDLATSDLGLPGTDAGQLLTGLEPAQLPTLPTMPAESSDLTKASVAQLPRTNKLPLIAQAIRSTDGVNARSLPTPQAPADLPVLPGLSGMDTTMPSLGDLSAATELPTLPAV